MEKKVIQNLSPLPHSKHKNQLWVIINLNGKEKQQNFQMTLYGNIFIISGYVNKTHKALTMKKLQNELIPATHKSTRGKKNPLYPE